MRNIPIEMIPGHVREIDGHAVVRVRLPVFTEDYDRAYRFHDHDIDLYGAGLYRAASISTSDTGHPLLFTREVPDPDNVPATLVNTQIQTFAHSGLSVCGGRIFYHKHNGDIVRRDIATESELVYTNVQSDVGLAAVTSTEVFVMRRISNTTCVIELRNGLGKIAEWDGAAYGEGLMPSSLDAERIDGVDYIVWQNADKRNARWMQRVGDIWSDTQLVFPLDVVDDTFQFRLGGASVIDNRLVLVGTMVRNDSNLKVYTIGPGNFTLGREMFIAPGHVYDRMLRGKEITQPIGKMCQLNDMLYVIGGDNRRHYAKSTMLFGSDREDQRDTVDIHSASMDMQANRPSRVTFEVKDKSPLLEAGNVIDWHAQINGVEARMGRFAIEVVTEGREFSGKSITVVAQSLSAKSMASWVSDSSFDYWSQTKQTSGATNIAKTIRGGGLWEEEGESLRFKTYNRPGILYSVEKATRNGTAVGEFRVIAAENYSARYGVAIAYHRETPQDAAARLGESFATENDTVSHGIFFTVDSSNGSAKLYFVVNDVWTQIATGSQSITTTQWHWLRVDFRDGRVRCYFRTGVDWVKVIDHRLSTNADWPHPWFKDEIGRAALYLENIVPGAKSYPFTQNQMFIPVETVSPFSVPGIVKVDDEFIRYNGKSLNRSLASESSPLEWANGKTYPGVITPHNNKNVFPDQTFVEHSDTPIHWRYGHAQEMIGGSFKALDNWNVKAVEVYLSKMGTADAYAEIWLGNDDSDNAYWPPDSTILAKRKRLFKHGSPAGMSAGTGTFYGGEGWVRFSMDVNLRKNESYFIYLANKAGANIPASGYFNLGFLQYRKPNTVSVRYTYDPNVSGYPYWKQLPQTLRMRVIGGGGTNLPGHEIYIKTVGAQRSIDYYNGCALVCVAGPGQGRSMKIVGYDYHAPHQWVGPEDAVGDLSKGYWQDRQYRRFFVDTDPRNAFGEGSMFIVVPTLTVQTRGINNTQAANHLTSFASLAGGSSAELGRGAEARTFEYYSGDKDISLGEMITEIARKANVLTVNQEMRLSGEHDAQNDFSFTRALLNSVPGETAIVEYEATNWASGGVGMAVFAPGFGAGQNVNSVAVLVYENNISFYRAEDSNIVQLQNFPIPHGIEGKFTISFQKDVFSVWNNGQYLTHFYWKESEAQETTFDRGYSIGIINDGLLTCNIEWSELDSRVDNYILDIGQTGLSLVQGLIGEKRAFFMDTQDGDLRLFRNRDKVNPDAPLHLQVSQADYLVDAMIRTRLRSEGVEIVEMTDFEALAKHGNLFAMIGLREPDNIAETARELDLIMEDILCSSANVELSGMADPRIEPEDLVLVTMGIDDHRFIRAETIGLSMVGGDSPVFDMQIVGSVWADGNVRSPRFVSADRIRFTSGKEQKFTIIVDADPVASIEIGEL